MMEVREVDTKPQFKSVKEAISLFSGGAFIENKLTMMRSGPYLQRVATKESEQQLVQKELNKLRRQVRTGNLGDMETYSENEEGRKVIKDIKSKLLNSFGSGELSNIVNITPELIDVKKDQSSSENMVDVLKLELQSLKEEHYKLMIEESLTESICSSLKSQKLELSTCVAEESAARGQFDELLSSLREMLSETRYARKEEEDEMKLKIEKVKKQAEAVSSTLLRIVNELIVAMDETEEAKSSEARICNQIKTLSENVRHSTDSTPESIITIPEEEFEYFIHRIHETDTITEMKVAAAREQLKSAKYVEHKALKKLKRRKKQIEDMQAIIDLASKRAQVAKFAEKELRKQHKTECQNCASRTSSSRTEAETETYSLTITSKGKLIGPQINIKEQYIAGGGCFP